MLITRALYGLKTSSASFRSYLAETLYELGYTPTKSDPDVWLLRAVKADGFQYYEMVLCYVDDVIRPETCATSLQPVQSTSDQHQLPSV